MFTKKRKLLIFFIILLAIIQAGLFVFFLDGEKYNFLEATIKINNDSSKNLENLPIHYSYFSSQEFFNNAYELGKSQVKEADSRARGGIIPHHLIVADKIAAYFLGLEKYNYDTVILIGPDHFLNTKSRVALSNSIWKTPYGDLETNLKLANIISSLPEASFQESAFTSEHSISGLVSFIKKSFTKAKIVPIVLSSKISLEECEDIAETISKNTDKEKTLVLASVDFSHYMPTDVANFHDVKSKGVIQSFDFSRIFNLEIDSPASIYTLLKYLEFEDAHKNELLFSTNSGTLTGKEDEPTTSHNFYYFTDGQKEKNDVISTLFFGDLMLDRYVGEKIKKNGLGSLFSEISGEENRFFMGLDFISANLEGPVTNNGNHYDPIMSYDFAFAPTLIQELIEKQNFNFFNLANNHFSDQGERGIIETRKNLDNLGVNYSGCRDKKIDDCSYRIVEINNKKIGMVGFSTVYGLIDMDRMENLIKELREKTDIIITNIHWGVEYEHAYNNLQQDIAHKLIDSGVDIIIGHHPHVVQGIEIYSSKRASTNGAHTNLKKGIIFYSLGNFIFDQYFSKNTQEGLSVGINILNQKLEISLFPFISKMSQPGLMNGTEKEKFLNNIISWSRDLENIYKKELEQGKFIIDL